MYKQSAAMLFLALLSVLVCAGCAGSVDPDSADGHTGRILLWHSWNDAEAAALDEILVTLHSSTPTDG